VIVAVRMYETHRTGVYPISPTVAPVTDGVEAPSPPGLTTAATERRLA
jgi:hypothetical protein